MRNLLRSNVRRVYREIFFGNFCKVAFVNFGKARFILPLMASLTIGQMAAAQSLNKAPVNATAQSSNPPKAADIASAPAPSAQSAHHKEHSIRGEKALTGTFDLLSRRSLFFPELAYQKGPLTRWDKFALAADESIAPSRPFSSGVTSAIQQARDVPAGYGEGWQAYGRRFGSSMGSATAANVFGTFALASLFHQDPRYFVHPNASPGARIGYALRRVVVTPTDSGGRAFNISGLLGAIMAESLANAYLPDPERTAGKTFQRFGIRIGGGAAVNVVREYWPSISRSLGMKKLLPNTPQPNSEPPNNP